MADTDQVVMVRLGADDARAGLALSTEAHWNQNEDDWRFFLNEGTVFGVRDHDGSLVASAALLPYASGNAWISMVLVTQNRRRQGLATKLIDRCLEVAAKSDLVTWLDATPAGAAVYGPLGFKPILELRRLRLENCAPVKANAPEPLLACDLTQFSARDSDAMGFDRSALLTELGERSGSRLLSNGHATALIRDGRKARHIGPLFADGPDQALTLVDAIAQSETRPLLIDAVSSQAKFLQGLTGSSWNIERPFQRMRFGRATVQPAELPFAVAGPEYG
jgi:GNAT superfamily N-acetyltransferase